MALRPRLANNARVSRNAPPLAPRPHPPAGTLLRDWRQRRRRSQLDLALECGVSQRHLSCIETGRARPSPQTLLALAQCLDVPLRERNDLLLAAGFAPRYGECDLGEAEMDGVRQALSQLLAAHDPLPGVVVDRHWNLVLANRGAALLTAGLPAALTAARINVMRVSLHPQGLARLTENFAEWAPLAVASLRRQVQRSGDACLQTLLDEVCAFPNVRAVLDAASAASRPTPTRLPLLVPFVFTLPAGRVSLFTTLTTFGTPLDVTLDELCVELFYPADAVSAAVMRGLAGDAANGPPGV